MGRLPLSGVQLANSPCLLSQQYLFPILKGEFPRIQDLRESLSLWILEQNYWLIGLAQVGRIYSPLKRGLGGFSENEIHFTTPSNLPTVT